MKTLYSKILNANSPSTPLVILHGLFGMSDNWYTLGKKWAAHRPVHLLDLRNHGQSFHAEEMTLELMAEDVNHYLEEHSIAKCYMMGHSLGGKVVLEFMNSYIEKLIKAIIVDMGIKEYPPHHQNILKGLQILDFNIDNSRKKINDALTHYIREVDIRQFLMKNIERTQENTYKFVMNLDSIQNNYLSLLREIKTKQKITLPILFIKGEASNYIESQDILSIKNNYPNSEVVSISEAGHWVHAQKPEEFYKLVESFLDK